MPKGEELFAPVGNMMPSKSTLARLPKELSANWEPDRRHFEQALREGDVVPPGATSVAISLDGVLVPMKDAQGAEKRQQIGETLAPLIEIGDGFVLRSLQGTLNSPFYYLLKEAKKVASARLGRCRQSARKGLS